MSNKSRVLKKIAVAAEIATLSVGLLTAVSMETLASGSGGGGGGNGCYYTTTISCAGNIIWSGGERIVCNFTGTYGSPTNCTYTECGNGNATYERHCVQPTNP